MATKDEVIETIHKAIASFNLQMPEGHRIPNGDDVLLFGRDGALDSVGLVNLIVATEQAVRSRFDVAIALASDRAMSQKTSPFRSVSALAEFVHTLVNEQLNGL